MCGHFEQEDGTKVLMRIGTINMNNKVRRGSDYFVDQGTMGKWEKPHQSGIRIPENTITTTLKFWQSKDRKSVVIMQNTSIWTWWIEEANWTLIVLPSPPGRHVFEVPVRYAFGCNNIFI